MHYVREQQNKNFDLKNNPLLKKKLSEMLSNENILPQITFTQKYPMVIFPKLW